MTVKELIEILNKIEDKNRVCMIASEDVGGSYEVDGVVETVMKDCIVDRVINSETGRSNNVYGDVPTLFIGLDWYHPKRNDKFYYCDDRGE